MADRRLRRHKRKAADLQRQVRDLDWSIDDLSRAKAKLEQQQKTHQLLCVLHEAVARDDRELVVLIEPHMLHAVESQLLPVPGYSLRLAVRPAPLRRKRPFSRLWAELRRTEKG